MGLKGKRIAVIAENRYEWEQAYLAICCGAGVVVPLDKALTANEIEGLIIRSEVEAIFYSDKYDEIMANIQKNGNTKLKYFISMSLEKNEFNKFSQKEITKKGEELLKTSISENRNIKDYFELNDLKISNIEGEKCKKVTIEINSVFGSIIGIKKY